MKKQNRQNRQDEQDDIFSAQFVVKSGKVKNLEMIISHLDTCYEEGSDCIHPITGEIVLDNEYDQLKKELFDLCPESFIFDSVTSSQHVSSSTKVIHDPPMTSINKCNGTEDEKKKILLKWFQDCFGNKYSHIPNAKTDDACIDVAMSYKHDGIAMSLIYENGKLIKAGLRSKSGKDGIDVTDKTKYIKHIPQKLALPLTCIIRGEIETPISVFNRVSSELGSNAKANPRAHTAGSMNLKDAEDIKDRGLGFIAYNIIGLGDKYYKTEIERAAFARWKLDLNYIEMGHFIWQNLEHMEKDHRNLDYMVDGVVLSVNNLALQESLGNTGDKDTGNPKGKIAFKFADDIKQTVVIKIIWQTGRTGNVTPVLIIDPVQLEGTTVTKCTAHNLGIIKQNNIGPGSVIEIIKSGKIIPKIHKVVRSGTGCTDIPSKCPSCNESLSQEKGDNGALSLLCTNIHCPAQNIKMLDHFLATIGVKGISEKTIEKLSDLGMVKKPGDFYRLSCNKLEKAGITTRTAKLIIAKLNMVNNPEQMTDDELSKYDVFKKNGIRVPVEKFFASFGIRSAGNSAGEVLSKKYGDWNKIKNLSVDDLENIDGIGPVTAKEITEFFRSNREMIEDVEQYFFLEFRDSKGVFKDMTFVLSGSLDGGKERWKKFIEDNGGSVKGSVGRKINYLVAGEGSGEKSDKAKSLNIEIIDTTRLEKMAK